MTLGDIWRGLKREAPPRPSQYVCPWCAGPALTDSVGRIHWCAAACAVSQRFGHWEARR